MDLALYKEFYDREWERHEHLQSAVNTPISIVTLLAGGLVLMGKGFESTDLRLNWVFWSSAAVAMGLIAACAYLLIRSIHGYRYKRMPFLSELAVHKQALAQHFEHRGIPGLTDQAFDDYLAKQYTAASDNNAANNFQRGEYLYRANRFLVYALCATALVAVPAGIAVKTVRPSPEEVRITNLKSDADAILERWSGTCGRPGPADGPVRCRGSR